MRSCGNRMSIWYKSWNAMIVISYNRDMVLIARSLFKFALVYMHREGDYHES